MEWESKNRERVPITKWPELERKMGIIARMTSDPPLPESSNSMAIPKEGPTQFSDKSITIERELSPH